MPQKISPLTSVRFFLASFVLFHHSLRTFFPGFSGRVSHRVPEGFLGIVSFAFPVAVSFFYFALRLRAEPGVSADGQALQQAPIFHRTVCTPVSAVLCHVGSRHAGASGVGSATARHQNRDDQDGGDIGGKCSDDPGVVPADCSVSTLRAGRCAEKFSFTCAFRCLARCCGN